MKQEKLYHVFYNMRRRCLNPKSPMFHRYGGRGITICNEWDKYKTFREWALSNGYEVGLQIDRKDNDGNYTPENCRFVSPKQNSNNTGRVIYLTAFGETKTMAEWAEDARCVVPYKALQARVSHGWSTVNAENTITQPSHAGVREGVR